MWFLYYICRSRQPSLCATKPSAVFGLNNHIGIALLFHRALTLTRGKKGATYRYIRPTGEGPDVNSPNLRRHGSRLSLKEVKSQKLYIKPGMDRPVRLALVTFGQSSFKNIQSIAPITLLCMAVNPESPAHLSAAYIWNSIRFWSQNKQ